MQGAPLISYSANREDVVLWRALHDVDRGRYAEIGLRGPQSRSMTRVLAEHGWVGRVVTVDDDRAREWRSARPRDSVETAQTSRAVAAAVDRVAAPEGDLHVLVVPDDAPILDAVLDDERLGALAPWVLVVTDAAGSDGHRLDARLSNAGYRACLFDGVSRFYVSEARPELTPSLSYPACVDDDFTDLEVHELRQQVAALELAVDAAREADLAEILRWRHAAVSTWAATAAVSHRPVSGEEVGHLRSALAAAQEDAAAVRQTLSWRVTTPLRAVRSVGRRS